MNLDPLMNQDQGSIAATISTQPRIEDVSISIVTDTGATMEEDGPCPQVQLVGKKRVSFDIAT